MADKAGYYRTQEAEKAKDCREKSIGDFNMNKPNLHIIAPWHVILNPELQSTCAFGMKAYKLSAMMQPLGYKCFEYSNAGSTSACENKITMLTMKEHEEFFPALKPTEFQGSYATIGNKGWVMFDARLREAMSKHVKAGDIICHVFGQAHVGIVDAFPQAIHCETGVGYPDRPFGAFRVFESSVWRAYHWGRDDQDSQYANQRGNQRRYSWIIPNSFDASEWPYMPKDKNEDYVLFMSRIDPCKGLSTIAELIRADSRIAKEKGRKPIKWVFAGQGEFEKNVMANVLCDPRPDDAFLDIEHKGPVYGKARAELAGKARCMILPTNYVEPFGGAIIEGQLTGTPSVTVDYGCFTETVKNYITGFRCNTLGDFLAAISACKNISREYVAQYARMKYDLAPVSSMYDIAFQEMNDLTRDGWYSKHSHRYFNEEAQQA